MSSFNFASPPDIPQDFRQVRVVANLGALFGFPGVSFTPYDVPQSTLPFPFQQLDVETPLQLYQSPSLYLPTVSNTHSTLTANNLHYPNYLSPSPIPSREATPSSTTGSTVGPIRGSTAGRRRKPYARRSAPSSSQLSTPTSEHHPFSSVTDSRLAIQGVCRLNGCGQTFTSTDVYTEHVRMVHGIKKGKNGKTPIQCEWDGCGEMKTKASIWNHVLGHNTKSACYICHGVLKGTRADSMKRHLQKCSTKSTTIASETSEPYIFFCEEE